MTHPGQEAREGGGGRGPPLFASAAVRLKFFLALFPVRHQGALVLYPAELRFERATRPPSIIWWEHDKVAISSENFTQAQEGKWPSEVRATLAWFLAPWYAFTSEHDGANLNVETPGAVLHFRVDNPARWTSMLNQWKHDISP